MSSAKDLARYYEVLGLPTTASPQQIKQAYRDLVKLWHPDRYINDPLGKVKAEREIKKINEAYAALKHNQESIVATNDVASSAGMKNTPEYHYQAGIVCAEAEDYRGAIAEFSLAIKLNPDYLEVYQYRGFIFSKLGYENRANADLQQAERLKLRQKYSQAPPSPHHYANTGSSICRLTRTIMAHKKAVNCVAINDNGQVFASGGQDKKIKLWQLDTGEAIANLVGHSGSINCLLFDRRQQFLISGSQDKTIRFWNWEQRKIIRTFGGWFTGHTKGINSLVMDTIGHSLISGSDDNSIKIWDLKTGKARETIASSLSTVTCLAISQDSRFFCSGGLEKQLRIRSVQTGAVIRSIRGNSGILSIIFSPDGNLLVTGGCDRQIIVWDIVSRQKIYTLTGHSGRISSLAFSLDGKILISGSWDKTIKLWKLNTGKEIATITGHNDRVLSLAIAPDGKTLVSSSADGVIKIWQCNF